MDSDWEGEAEPRFWGAPCRTPLSRSSCSLLSFSAASNASSRAASRCLMALLSRFIRSSFTLADLACTRTVEHKSVREIADNQALHGTASVQVFKIYQHVWPNEPGTRTKDLANASSPKC